MNYNELEKMRKKAYLYNIFMILGVIIFISGPVLIVFLEDANLVMFFPILMFLGISLNLYFWRKQKAYKHKIKEKLVKELVVEHCGKDVYFNMKGRLPEIDEIIAMGLVDSPDRMYSDDYYTTVYKDIRFSCADITLQERRVTRDSKGRTQTTYVDYYSGRMLVFDIKWCPQVIFIREKGSKIKYKKGLYKVATELNELNENYEILAADKVDIYKFLTPVVLQGLMSLEKMIAGVLSYAFINGKLYVFVERNSGTLEVRVSKKLDEAEVNFLITGLRLPFEIIDKLKLNEDYFQKD